MFDGNGNWTSDFSAQADRDNGIKILASRFDNIFIADIKESFENCLTKDGQIVPIGNFNAGGYRVTNVANGVNSGDAVNMSQLDTTVTNIKNTLFPVGSLYSTIGNTNPNSLLGFGTWSLVTSSVITSVDTNVPCKGDGTTLGLTDGSNNFGLLANNRTYGDYNGSASYYGKSVGSTGHGNDIQPNNGKSLGITTDKTKSGIIGTITRTSTTIYIWKRTA